MFLIRKTTTDNIGRTRPVVSKNTEIKKNEKKAVVEEGCFTPFLCGGILLTFGGNTLTPVTSYISLT